jgi:hypothetical protein
VSDRVSHADVAGSDAATWSANTVARITALDTDPEIHAFCQRLFDASVALAVEGEQDADGLWTSLVLRCPRT